MKPLLLLRHYNLKGNLGETEQYMTRVVVSQTVITVHVLQEQRMADLVNGGDRAGVEG